MGNTINWLHLSDLHFGYQENIVKQMRRELPKYIKKYFDTEKVDYIFITGDIIYGKSNADDSYKQAYNFICEIMDIIDVDNGHVYIVPGNHDYERTPGRTSIIKEIQQNYTTECGNIDKGYFKMLEIPQKKFGEFYERLCNRKFNMNHFLISDKINILNLNSTITSCNSKDDISNLILGMDFVDDALSEADITKPLFVLSHHSFEWFRMAEREKLELHLKRHNASLFLCGHIHKARYSLVASMDTDNHLYECLCATNMNKDESNHASDMGFFTGHYDIENLVGEIVSHEWNKDREKFIIGETKYFYQNSDHKLKRKQVKHYEKNDNGNFDLPTADGEKISINEIANITRIFKFSEFNNRAWIERKDAYYKLNKELFENDCDIVFINGLEDDEDALTVYYWLISKEIDKKSILYFKIGEDETGDILLNLWDSYYQKNKLCEQNNIYLMIEGLTKENENCFLNTFSCIINKYSNLKLIVFSESYCESISEMRRYNKVESLAFGALSTDNINDFFNLYKKSLDKKKIEVLKKTGYSITVLKKCIKYIDNGLSLEEAVEICMKTDYPKLIDGTDVKKLSDDELRLAAALALFNMPFSKKIAGKFQNKYCKNKNALYGLLKKGVLINNSEFSLCVAPEYVSYLRSKSNVEFKELIYKEIARYYYLTYEVGLKCKQEISNSVMCGLNACKYFQKAKEFDLVNTILNSTPGLLRNAKKRGFYLELIEILKMQHENAQELNCWNIYNLVHCLIITGQYSFANKILTEIKLEDVIEYDCKIGILRLMCEVMTQYEDTSTVLNYIEKEYNKHSNKDVLNAMNNQIQMLMVRLYMEEKNYEKAQKLCDSVINQCENLKPSNGSRRNKEYSIAVASTYLVQKKIFNNEIVTAIEFEQIKERFKNLNDKRGYSWILGIEGQSLIKDDHVKAYKSITESINNRKSINECSSEYLKWLKNIKLIIDDDDLLTLINAEEKRIKLYNRY